MATNPIGFPRLLTGFLLSALALSSAARAQDPQIGDVQRLKVISVSLRVGSTEKETEQVVYSPPPGWYVRSHSVHCTFKAGNSSYSVNTLAQDWKWLSEEKVTESGKLLTNVSAKAHDEGLEGKFVLDQETEGKVHRKVRTTHHALVLDATAKGAGVLRGGGGVELTITAELIYLGPERDLPKRAEQQRSRPR